jgi:anaerobic magnesium-protoporphyrin IX monomethyl ester cyclase
MGMRKKMTDQITDKKNLKLLFVNPCLRRNSFTKLLPVGLAYVMTYFHENGYDFELLDIDLNEYEDSYVEEYLLKNKFDVILTGSIVTHYKWMKWFIHTAKRLQPQAQVIVGNSVASSIPEVLLTHTPADIAVMGEGEVSAYEAVEALRTKKDLKEIEGIAFRSSDGEIIQTPKRKAGNINDLPMINWDFFDVEKYMSISAYSEGLGRFGQEQQTSPMPVTTARGCAFKCTFCHYVFWNDPYRHRSNESILAEIERNITQYKATYINFWDDLSFASARQAEHLADGIIASGLKFDWSAAVRVDLFNRNKLSQDEALQIAIKMRDSGCKAVGFSLESGNAEILEMMNKKIQAEDFFQTVKIFRQVGIVCNTSVVFGYPIETKESIRQTFEQCLKAKVYPSIGFLLPLPATGMYAYAQQNGFITDEDAFLCSITERQDICMNMTTLSDQEIMEEIKVGASQLNELLNLGLDEESYIRTGRYQNDKSELAENALDPENIQRNENDFSFNYSQAVFSVDAGTQEVVA